MFRKILACVDGSERSLKAVRAAAELAKSQQGELAILHVAQLPEAGAPFPGAPELSSEVLEQYARQLHQAIRARIRPEVDSVGVLYDFIEERGNPVATIVRVADSRGFDLVVMGSRGLSEERAAQLGSVSDRVVHRAHCAVLIVR